MRRVLLAAILLENPNYSLCHKMGKLAELYAICLHASVVRK